MTENEIRCLFLTVETQKDSLAQCEKMYLDDSRVLRQGACWFGWLTHSQILNVTASEDDVLESVISGRDGSVCGTVLSAKGTN